MLLLAALLAAASPAADALVPADYAADARAIDAFIADDYAYLDRFPGGKPPASARLAAERDAVHDRDSLLHYAEDAIAALADHHAITGSSFRDSWGLVPTFADLWVVRSKRGYVVDAVRTASPAEAAGIRAGDRLVAIDGVAIDEAVAGFWQRLGIQSDDEHDAYAARVLATGRRDRPRHLTIAGTTGERVLTLDNLYAHQEQRPPVTTGKGPHGWTVRINNSLGDSATIAAFDAAIAGIPSRALVTIDLTDTPSGGDSYIARAIMGWFVTRPTAYQMHNLPGEERETGIPRQWIEQVLPRAGKSHAGRVTVQVGRWTGSMGEGLAIGLAAIGARVEGSRMAGLRGAVYDFTLPKSGLTIKLPAERLFTVGGVPREQYVPAKPGNR